MLVVADNVRLGAGWASDGPQAGYFPLRIGILIAVCSAIVIVQAFRHKADETIFVEWAKLVPVGKILFPLILYIAAMQYLGLYVASTLFVGGLMRWLEQLGRAVLVLIAERNYLWLFETCSCSAAKGRWNMFGY